MAKNKGKSGGVRKVMNNRPEGIGREVIYPEVQLIFYSGDGSQKTVVKDRPAITAEQMKKILLWETEAEWIVRQQAVDPTFDGGFPDVGRQVVSVDPETGVEHRATVLLKDNEGQKVVCWNIVANRPFDEGRCRQYVQDMANRQWAGPTTLPGETVNGETLVIGRTGAVESGQKRGVALVLLHQLWKKHCEMTGVYSFLWPKEKYPDGPVLDIPVFVGISENPRVIRTLDNVQTRTTSDTYFSSPLFDELLPGPRKECCRSCGVATGLLWDRTGAGKQSAFHKYRTHSEEAEFLDRHPRLRKCVLHLQKCNSTEGRGISQGLGMSAGECAAIMYLMGHGDSDIDVYSNAEPRPKESVLDCGLMDRASEFWEEVGKVEGDGATIAAVVSSVVDKDAGSIKHRKYAILSKAWALYVDDQPIDEESISLNEDDFQVDEHGKTTLSKPFHFNHGDNGIDLGSKVTRSQKDAEAAKAEAAKEKEEARRKAVEEADRRLKAVQKKNGQKNGNGGNGKKGRKKAAEAPAEAPSTPTTADFADWEPPVEEDEGENEVGESEVEADAAALGVDDSPEAEE